MSINLGLLCQSGSWVKNSGGGYPSSKRVDLIGKKSIKFLFNHNHPCEVGGSYRCEQFFVLGSGDLQLIYTWSDGIPQSSIFSCTWYTNGALCAGEYSVSIDGLGVAHLDGKSVRIPWSE